jgi:ketosteroid isomerase-like protein
MRSNMGDLAMRRCTGFILLLICFSIVACARPWPDAPEREVRGLLATLDHVQSTGDLEGFGDLMAENIVFMPPDGPSVVGKAAVLDFYRGLFADATLAIRHDPEESAAQRGMVVHRGRAVGSVRPKSAGGTEIPFENKYLYVLRRGNDGRLRFTHVIFNSSQAPVSER